MPTDDLADLYIRRIAACLRETGAADATQVYACALQLSPREMDEPFSHQFSWNDEANFYTDADDAAERAADRYLIDEWSADIDLDDAESLALLERTYTDQGLLPLGPDLESMESVDRAVELHRAQALFIADLARRLHREGVIRDIVGYDVLVLCETGSDQEPWTQLTLDANPPELHGEFLLFHEHEGVHRDRF